MEGYKMELERDFKEFREVTLELFQRIHINGNRLFLLKRREEILERIKNSNYNSQDIDRICKSLNIYELEKQLHEKVKEEINSVKMEIIQLKQSHQGNEAYVKSRYSGYMQPRFDKKY